MQPLLIRAAIAAVLLAVPFAASDAQRVTPTEARALLQAHPELIAQLRARVQGSGLTASQIRARLEGEGYPSSLLDAYLGDAFASDSVVVNEEVLQAVRSLGIADSAAVDSLRQIGRGDQLRDDSTAVATDSLGALSLLRQLKVGVDSGYTIFGQDIFSRRTTLFDANLSGPVDANYRLGPGDQLVLILTGDVEDAYTLEVTREGFIVIPRVGQISVANLTLAQLTDVLFTRLGRVYSGVRRGAGATTRFTVSVAKLRSNQVYVLGDVSRPGAYRVSSAGTMLSALYAAGGPTENGNMRAVRLQRGGRAVGEFDLYDYLLRGNSAHDLRLETGDVVFVPPRGPRVRIYGEVVRPATYELRDGETLADLIRSAGGLSAAAERRRVQIERILPPSQRSSAGSDRIVMDVASEQFTNGDGPAIPLQSGDVVRVFAVANRVAHKVTVRGHVWTPGQVGFAPGMRLSNALRFAGGLKPDAYLGQVLITRLQPDSTRVQLRTALQDTTGTAIDDLALADGDEIEVFSQSDFRPTRYVVVSGMVRNGGRYRYREGMTLRDLVLLAGGLQEGALLTEAEVARMPENRAAGVMAEAVRVPLDSSYLFDGSSRRTLGSNGSPAPRQQGGQQQGVAPDVTLQPYDNVLIFRQPDWAMHRTVVITGEVRYPGRYTLRSKSERLSHLIERAGGLTPDAYAAGISFTRTDRKLGRIGVDLPKVLRSGRHRDNLILVDGDSVSIPVFNSVVNVRGSVNSPVAVAYVPGRDLDYYVGAAGGVTRKGALKYSYVTQPNGKVEARRGRGMLPDAKPRPQAGSVIFVPDKDPADRRDLATMILTTTQVITSLIGVIVLARQFK
jgi:polysaccharide export outer membrane protein